MDSSAAGAAFASWALDVRIIAVLLLAAALYLRGWWRGRRLLRTPEDIQRLAAFLGSLAVVFIASESPLDAFDSLFLSAHMTQHLLLMMIAPPLLLFSHPFLPLLRGLPKRFVKEGLGPFLSYRPLQAVAATLVSPIPAWSVFAFSTIFWHIPRFYELALSSAAWHAVQHATFFWSGVIFWWPIVQPGPGKPSHPRWIAIPYLLFADILNTGLAALFVFSSHLLYPSYGLLRAGHLSALEDQSLAGLIMWVPGSVVYLVPAFLSIVGLFSTKRSRQVAVVERVCPQPKIVRRSRAPLLRRGAQAALLLIAIWVAKDGFTNSAPTPLNLAGVLPWVHWRALSVLALLLVGNLFCLACPFMLVRDGARRLVQPRFRWPRALRNKWLACGLLLFYLWAYEAFSLWDSPWLTAWIMTGYFVAASLTDVLFKGATFCKYICPIGQYHFVLSLVSPREVRVRRLETCQSCQTHDCIKGNASAPGCELYLFQPKKAGNLDCTFCLDCVKACPHDNVALLPVTPARTLLSDPYRSSLGRLSKRTDLAALALVIVFAAFVNAAGMVAPVTMWQHQLHARLGSHAMPFIVGAFVLLGAGLLPLLLLFIRPRRLAFALVPLGASMWAAHLFFHAAAVWTSAPVVWLQILLLDAGLLGSLYCAWRMAERQFRPFVSWAAAACALFTAGVWIFFQPMQMRGMIH